MNCEEDCKCISFTPDEVKALKEIARDKIRFDSIHNFDEHGKPIPYRNRYSIDPPHLCADEHGVLCKKCQTPEKGELGGEDGK